MNMKMLVCASGVSVFWNNKKASQALTINWNPRLWKMYSKNKYGINGFNSNGDISHDIISVIVGPFSYVKIDCKPQGEQS